MINFISRFCCISEESSKICVTSAPSIICLFTSVSIASSSVAEYSKVLQEDQENIFLIRTLSFLGVSGIISGIVSMSNCLQIIFQLSTASVCMKIQKIWQSVITLIFLAGIIVENWALTDESNKDRILGHLVNAEIALAILAVFTILMHFFC